MLLIVSTLFFSGCSSRETTVEKSPPFEAAPESQGVEPFMSEEVRAAYRRSCASCHGHDAHGILGVAPDLRRAKPRTSAEWETYLRDGRGAHPAGQPPPLWITGDELTALAAWLDAQARTRP
ncbi:MAG: cytochrome c [Blastocatellia bacterium]|nr:cytochrome c [Blastocatellia bacterium]